MHYQLSWHPCSLWKQTLVSRLAWLVSLCLSVHVSSRETRSHSSLAVHAGSWQTWAYPRQICMSVPEKLISQLLNKKSKMRGMLSWTELWFSDKAWRVAVQQVLPFISPANIFGRNELWFFFCGNERVGRGGSHSLEWCSPERYLKHKMVGRNSVPELAPVTWASACRGCGPLNIFYSSRRFFPCREGQEGISALGPSASLPEKVFRLTEHARSCTWTHTPVLHLLTPTGGLGHWSVAASTDYPEVCSYRRQCDVVHADTPPWPSVMTPAAAMTGVRCVCWGGGEMGKGERKKGYNRLCKDWWVVALSWCSCARTNTRCGQEHTFFPSSLHTPPDTSHGQHAGNISFFLSHSFICPLSMHMSYSNFSCRELFLQYGPLSRRR